MKRSISGGLALAVAAVMAVAAPAAAQQRSITDPAGDADNPGLDITGATVHNRDHAVVATVRFTELVRGDLIVSVDPRGARGVRLVSRYTGDGPGRTILVAGAFTDRGDFSERPVRCRGLEADWSVEKSTATLRMPARCLHHGRYGAVRFAVLTERGADTDFAPDRRSGVSGWIARG